MLTKLTAGCRQITEIEVVAFLVALVMSVCPVAIATAAEIRVGGAVEACNGMFTVIKEQIRDETGTCLF